MTERPLYGVASLRSESQVGRGRGEVTVDAVPPEMLHGVFAADWREIARLRVAPGAALGPRRLTESEIMFFVLAGGGRAYTAEGEAIELQCDTAVTLTKGELLRVQAEDEGLELYLIEIGADGS